MLWRGHSLEPELSPDVAHSMSCKWVDIAEGLMHCAQGLVCVAWAHIADANSISANHCLIFIWEEKDGWMGGGKKWINRLLILLSYTKKEISTHKDIWSSRSFCFLFPTFLESKQWKTPERNREKIFVSDLAGIKDGHASGKLLDYEVWLYLVRTPHCHTERRPIWHLMSLA